MTDVIERRPGRRRMADAADAPAFTVSEPAMPTYVRSPVTAIRLAGALVTVGLSYLALLGVEHRSFASDFASTLASAPRWIVSAVVGVCQLALMVPALLGLLGLLVSRRFARVGRMMLAAVVCIAGLALISKLVGAGTLRLLPARHGGAQGASDGSLHPDRYGLGGAVPTVIDLGVIASWMFVDRGHWSRRWRHIGLVLLAAGVVAHLGVNMSDPAIIAITIAMAATASALVQLVVGAPNTRPRAAAVGCALQRIGYHVSSVERFDGFRYFAGFRVQLDDGVQMFVKVIGRDSWASLLPVRIYRFTRFRDAGQNQPFRSVRTLVEHEALCALKAHSDGVPTARLAVVTEFPPDAMLMAFDARIRRPVSDIPAADRDATLVDSIWDIVAALRRSRTVHRRLNTDALWVADDGTVAVVEFASASLGVDEAALSIDTAEVLAATAVMIGPERAVAAAVNRVGRDAVEAALPRLQPLALTSRTRTDVAAAGCLDDLRNQVQRVTGSATVPIVELERIRMRTIVTIATVALALWTLVPQLVGVTSLWSELTSARWSWAAAALGLSAITYLGAAIAFDGSTSEQLPLAPNVGLQVATSFVGVAVPGGALALATRFLRKRGVDTAAAVGAFGIDTLAGTVVHLTLVALFVTIAGTSGLSTFQLPSLLTIGIIAAIVVAVAAVGISVRQIRSQLTTRLLPAARRSIAGLGELARQPYKMIELFGGSLLITMSYLLALEVSVTAFGGGPAFTSVALVYLVGAGVASIVPTPGGVGAVEATLIAGLTSAGMPSTTATAAVILFRLATFWIPLIPGWFTFVVLQRAGDL